MEFRNQEELVRSRGALVEEGEVVTDKLRLPGVSKLHERPTAEIAEALTTALKSRRNVKKISWTLGEDYIEVTYSL